jgi:hypothetical protein
MSHEGPGDVLRVSQWLLHPMATTLSTRLPSGHREGNAAGIGINQLVLAVLASSIGMALAPGAYDKDKVLGNDE